MKSDHQLRQEVMDELAWDTAFDDNRIGVEVVDGVVTLTGHLSSYAQKYAAERAALRVGGLKGLAVEIDVRLPGASQRLDSDIAASARNALEWNVVLPREGIQIKVEGGWITLTGQVEFDYQREAAEQSLRNLFGLIGISNQLTVQARAVPRDIKSSIEAALQRRAHVQTKALYVTVNDRVVTLTGMVSSLAERQEAHRAALHTPGVERVIDDIVVV
ncbi:periplasmic or secreted lipoprotein [Herbaspirillum frisingense GSF30]|uniref:Periplasmic or secreted lipoprotein n=1 Tax=Herbaspirillum frisingense GSF30 TaxID=864073 RepID=A0AAI9IGK2_9BURK|nr:BON domain-containing protein [Herbaspirillum frisingense]EOA05823.1 periplasmic or secreted lipoprotein [Herbaspirillum frisingense GSF30]